MIAWAPRKGVAGPWHVLLQDGQYPAMSLCGVRVQGVERYVKRDPHKIDDYRGERCKPCWREWRMMTAASYAKQDQHEAGAFPRKESDD